MALRDDLYNIIAPVRLSVQKKLSKSILTKIVICKKTLNLMAIVFLMVSLVLTSRLHFSLLKPKQNACLGTQGPPKSRASLGPQGHP